MAAGLTCDFVLYRLIIIRDFDGNEKWTYKLVIMVYKKSCTSIKKNEEKIAMSLTMVL